MNLLVQRNIPVTFTNPAAAVINDTIEPAVRAADHEGDPGACAGKTEPPAIPATSNRDPSAEIDAPLPPPSTRQFRNQQKKGITNGKQ